MKILVNIDKKNNENVRTGTTPLNQKLLKLDVNKKTRVTLTQNSDKPIDNELKLLYSKKKENNKVDDILIKYKNKYNKNETENLIEKNNNNTDDNDIKVESITNINSSKHHSNHQLKKKSTTERRVSKPVENNYVNIAPTRRTHIRIKSIPKEYSTTTVSGPIKFNIKYNDAITSYHFACTEPIKYNYKFKDDKKEIRITNNSSTNSLTTESESNSNIESYSDININSNKSNDNKLSVDDENNNSNNINNINDNNGVINNNINNVNNNMNNLNSSNELNSSKSVNVSCSNCSFPNNKEQNVSNKICNKNSIGVANGNGYHTKCPNCDLSFDVLPGADNNDNDSDSALSSHSSLSEMIDKVIARRDKKKQKNLSCDSLTSLPENLQMKIDKISKKKHYLAKKDKDYIPIESNKEPKLTTCLRPKSQKGKSPNLKNNNVPPKTSSNKNLTSAKSPGTPSSTKPINNSSLKITGSSTNKLTSKNSLASPQNNKSTIVGSKYTLLKSNPKLSGSNAQDLNNLPSTSNNNNTRKSQLLSSNPIISSGNISKKRESTDVVSKVSPLKNSPITFRSKCDLIGRNSVCKASIKKSNSQLDANPQIAGSLRCEAIPVTSTVYIDKSTHFTPSQSANDVLKCEAIPVTSTVYIDKSTHIAPSTTNNDDVLRCEAIPVTSTVYIDKSTHIGPSPSNDALKCEAIPVTSTVYIDKSTRLVPSPSNDALKCEAIPVTSTVYIDKSTRLVPTPPSDALRCEAIPVTSTVYIDSPQKNEIDHISVYPVPFGSERLHNVPILPVSEKYNFDNSVFGSSKNVAVESKGVENENMVDMEQELNGLAHDLTSSFDSGSSDVFLLNELPENIDGSRVKLNAIKTSGELIARALGSNSKFGSKESLVNKLQRSTESFLHGSMNPITAQLLKAAKQERNESGVAENKSRSSVGVKETITQLLSNEDLGGLIASSLSLDKKSLLGSNTSLSKKVGSNSNLLCRKVLSGSLNSLRSGRASVRVSHSNLRNVTTIDYSIPNESEADSGVFKLPSTDEIYGKVSENVIHFIQNQWKQSEGISTTFQFLSTIKEGSNIDNNCNDYMIKPLVEYKSIFCYISPSWLKMSETELQEIKKSFKEKEEKKQFFVMPWKIEDQAINNGISYWICIIYDTSSNKYIIFDTKNEDIHAYGVCLMLQSALLNYMFDLSPPFYVKSLQEIIGNNQETKLETSVSDKGWEQIIICNSGLNHGDSGIDNVLMANYFVQNYNTVFEDVIQGKMDYEAIKTLLSSIKFSEFNTYIEKLFTISAIQYFNSNNMLC